MKAGSLYCSELARVIGINNRDLKDFSVSLETQKDLFL